LPANHCMWIASVNEDKRGYVHMCVTQISQRCFSIDRTVFVLGSLEKSTPSLIGGKQFWDVIWPCPIYLAPKWTSNENHVFSLYSVNLWINCSRYQYIFNGQVLGNPVWAFQYEPPASLALFGGRNMKKGKKTDFHIQMIKLCYKVVPIYNFQQQSCSSKCLEGNREIDAYLCFLQRFQ